MFCMGEERAARREVFFLRGLPRGVQKKNLLCELAGQDASPIRKETALRMGEKGT